MLPPKDTTKTQEIKALFQQTWKQPEFFAQHLNLFKFSKSFKLFNSVKKAVSPFGVDESFASAPFYEYKGRGFNV